MSNKEVAQLVINFLKNAIKDKEVSEDYVDSLDVAIDCVADAFEVNKSDDVEALKTISNGKTLKELLAAAQSDSAVAAEVPVHVDEEDEETKQKAEALKAEGNKAMARKDFQEAVDKYTAAITLTPKNKIYLSNRAAAYSSLRDHEKAVEDAQAAIEIDSTFSKAYSRLGLAYYALGKPKEAMEAYKKGMEVEGETPSDAMKRGYETAKKRVEESLGLDSDVTPAETSRDIPAAGAGAGGMPDLSSLLGGLGGAGGAGGAGGMPDFSSLLGGLGGSGGMPDLGSLMSNPMFSQMAQNLMSNPEMLNGIMNNPAVRDMANNAQNGGGMPDMASMMNNPAIRGLADQFMNSNSNGSGNNDSAGNSPQ